jgi:hypothetical protein
MLCHGAPTYVNPIDGSIADARLRGGCERQLRFGKMRRLVFTFQGKARLANALVKHSSPRAFGATVSAIGFVRTRIRGLSHGPKTFESKGNEIGWRVILLIV